MDASDWDERYSADGLLWTAQPNRFLVAEASALTPGSALDVACGEGRNAVWLATKGWQVTAVDQSEVGLDKGRNLAQQAGVAIEWLVGDVTSFQAPSEYDLVVVAYLHLPADLLRAAMSRAVAALAAGGTLIVVGHHSDNIERGIGGPQAPELLYRPSEIVELLGDVEVRKAEMVERPVDRPDASGVALDTLVTAVRR